MFFFSLLFFKFSVFSTISTYTLQNIWHKHKCAHTYGVCCMRKTISRYQIFKLWIIYIYVYAKTYNECFSMCIVLRPSHNDRIKCTIFAMLLHIGLVLSQWCAVALHGIAQHCRCFACCFCLIHQWWWWWWRCRRWWFYLAAHTYDHTYACIDDNWNNMPPLEPFPRCSSIFNRETTKKEIT